MEGDITNPEVQAKLRADDLGSRVWAENCSTTNPMATQVNGAPILKPHLLANGDVVRAPARPNLPRAPTGD